MIQALQTLLNKLAAPATDPQDEALSLQLATAALLIEMMQAYSDTSPAELASVRSLLSKEFGLDTAAVDQLLADATEGAREAPGFHPFTSRLNQGLSKAQKVQVIEYLWTIALADGEICAHESHLMRKLADLLYISRGDFIAAKTRAQAAHQRSH